MVVQLTPIGLRKFSPVTITMTSLLTLDHTTLFFYTLSLSSQRHTTGVENWRSLIQTGIDPVPKSVRSTAPSLTQASTLSSATSASKRPVALDDSIIDLCGPTPKKVRTLANPAVGIDVKITVKAEDDEEHEVIGGGGLSDREEIECSEAAAARASPLKYGARATSSVSLYSFHSDHANHDDEKGPRWCQNRRLCSCCCSASPSTFRTHAGST